MGGLPRAVTEAPGDPNRAVFHDGLTIFSFRFLEKIRPSAATDNIVQVGRCRFIVGIR
jgi:hypothetical protein